MSAADTPPGSNEFARYAYLDSARVEMLHARFERHRFTAHAHDTWAIGAVVDGTKNTSAQTGRPAVVGAGELYALPPHRPHAGHSLGDDACEYVMLYVPDDEWRTQCAIHRVSPDVLSTPVEMRRVAAEFARFAALSLRHPQRLSAFSGEWTLFVERVLSAFDPHGASRAPSPALATDVRLRRARDYLTTYADRNVSLDELAREASLSVFELVRRFTAAYGLSPHRYQLVLRVMNAKRQLLGGAAIPDVAIATGFADQSHLGRHFKAVLGVTPGTVAVAAKSGGRLWIPCRGNRRHSFVRSRQR